MFSQKKFQNVDLAVCSRSMSVTSHTSLQQQLTEHTLKTFVSLSENATEKKKDLLKWYGVCFQAMSFRGKYKWQI